MTEITTQEALIIIESRWPLGLFYCRTGCLYTGIDNSTGEAWTEDFADEESCINWLKEVQA